MLNAQSAGAMAYKINSIPYLILFSPDGTIIARGNTIEISPQPKKQAPQPPPEAAGPAPLT